jgi:hypothetical protein
MGIYFLALSLSCILLRICFHFVRRPEFRTEQEVAKHNNHFKSRKRQGTYSILIMPNLYHPFLYQSVPFREKCTSAHCSWSLADCMVTVRTKFTSVSVISYETFLKIHKIIRSLLLSFQQPSIEYLTDLLAFACYISLLNKSCEIYEPPEVTTHSLTQNLALSTEKIRVQHKFVTCS